MGKIKNGTTIVIVYLLSIGSAIILLLLIGGIAGMVGPSLNNASGWLVIPGLIIIVAISVVAGYHEYRPKK
jgi:uncharacterized membrane protein